MSSGYLRLLVACVGLVSSCVGWETDEPPVVPIRNMYNQPRWDTQEKKSFFLDERSMRPEISGVVSRQMESRIDIATGQGEDGEWILQIPPSVIARHGGMDALQKRGRQRYSIYCSPCHSYAGDGQGMVARRAEDLGAIALKPPTFHSDRLRKIPDGQIFATISNGVRNMPAYYFSIPVPDRWAIVSYVRALQLSQLPQPNADQANAAQVQ